MNPQVLRRKAFAVTAHGKRQPAAGATLVEFIVAVGILAFVLVFMFQLLPYSHIVDRQAWNSNTARDIAHTQMEHMRAYTIDYLPPSVGPVTEQHGNIQYLWTAQSNPYPTPVPAGGMVGLAVVTVEVKWFETAFTQGGRSGVQKKVISQTLVARQAPPGSN